MNDKPIEKWSIKDLKAEVELYRQAKVENVPEFEGATKEEIAAWITEERLNVGTPSVLAEDCDLGKKGDVIIVPPQPATPDQGQQLGASPEQPENEEKPRAEQKTVPKSEPVVPTVPPKQQYFRKKPVVAIENKLVNGRIYKQVTTPDDVSLLSEEEFNNEVR